MDKPQYDNGVYTISNAEYHASHGVSRSALMELRKSPYHYWYKYINPDFEKPEPTPAMQLGSLVHTMVLEPELFDSEYIIKPETTPIPKALKLKDVGREAYDANKTEREAISAANDLELERFQKAAENKTIVSRETYEQANAMKEAVLNDETARNLINDAQIERSIYFTHEPTGLQSKVRPDAWLGTVVTDLKTVRDASFRAFQNEAYKLGYFVQAGMIYKSLQSIDITMEKFVFMCVEKAPPYVTATYVLDDEAIDYGVILFDSLMERLKECCEQDRWPSYPMQTLSVPNYAKYDEV